MSQWTHIRGGLELDSSPYEMKKMPKSLIEPKKEDFETEEAFKKAHSEYRVKVRKLYYYPYPEEQFKLDMPLPGTTYGKKQKNGNREEYNTLEFRARVYSLPRARKYIEEAFKLIPQGESKLRYSIDQNITDSHSSSSGFFMPCEYKAYQDALTRMYYSEDSWYSYTYKELHDWLHVNKECWVEDVSRILIGIRDDIRYASAIEVQDGLEKAIKYLEDNKIKIEDGYLEWEDEWEPKYLYAWRKSRLDFDKSHQFLVLDKKTNKVVHSKTWVIKRDENGKRMHDDDWNCIWEIVELDGPYIPKKSK